MNKLIKIAFLFFLLSNKLIGQNIEFINPPDLAKTTRYSHVAVVRQGTMIYVSGQVAQDKVGNLVGKDDFKAQAIQVFENLKIALNAAGADFKDVIKINSYLLNMNDLGVLREVREVYLGNLPQKPASTAVQVVKLFQEGYLLEVEVVAVINEKPSKRIKSNKKP